MEPLRGLEGGGGGVCVRAGVFAYEKKREGGGGGLRAYMRNDSLP